MCTSEKILKKSISIAYSLFLPSREQESYHFSFGFHGSKLIGMGQNEPFRPNGRAMKIAKIFSNHHFQEFPYLHSETDLIGRLWGKMYLDRKVALVNIRLNRHGKLRKSRPCKNCQLILDSFNIENVLWSNNQNGFSKVEESQEVQFMNFN